MPTLDLETAVHTQTGFTYIAGLDEAGRGALAGPVVAAAVILPLDAPATLWRLRDVDDSKQLSPRRRIILFDLITQHALCWAVGSSPAPDVDRLGIIAANARAMASALARLNPPGQFLLIDGRMRLRNTPLPQKSVIRGDSLSLSIAAASILAKVTRDREMIALDSRFPQYGFARHKGYCTPQHVAALQRHGPQAGIHRYTFAPIRSPML